MKSYELSFLGIFLCLVILSFFIPFIQFSFVAIIRKVKFQNKYLIKLGVITAIIDTLKAIWQILIFGNLSNNILFDVGLFIPSWLISIVYGGLIFSSCCLTNNLVFLICNHFSKGVFYIGN